MTDDVKDAFSYAEKLNSEKYSGFDDWRVPSIKELSTILTTEKINNNYIKKALSKNAADNYWSSSDSMIYPIGENAWIIYFSNATEYNMGWKGYNCCVRCVRG